MVTPCILFPHRLFFGGLVRLLPVDRYPHALSRRPFDKGIYLLSIVSEEKITLPEGAAGHELYGVHCAGTVLNYSYKFLVFGPPLKLTERPQGHPIAQCKPWAGMSVKVNYFIVFFHTEILPEKR